MNAVDRHGFLDRLHHVIDRQAGDRHGGQRLHLDPGLAAGLDGGLDDHPRQGRIGRQVKRHLGHRQGVAQRDQIGGFLGRHDARQPRHAQHIALLGAALGDQRQSFARSSDTVPRATATRAVTGLPETSTICAWP